MTVRSLAVSDSLVGGGSAVNGDDGGPGGLGHVVTAATDAGVDAVVHTGNLFASPDPDDAVVDAVAETLGDLPEGVAFYAIPGERERMADADPLDRLVDRGVADRLGADPVLIGSDVALYGVGHVEADGLPDRLAALEPTDDYRYNVVCVHQSVYPLTYAGDTDVKAYELTRETDVFVNAVLVGGYRDPQRWDADDQDLSVVAPGSTNPAAHDDGGTGPEGVLVSVEDAAGTVDRRPLVTTDVDGEIATLVEVLSEYETADEDALAAADRDALADLYGLLSRAKSHFDDRRKDVREAFTGRIGPGETVEGRYATVEHRVTERRSVRDEDQVFAALEAAGVDRIGVLTESVDADALADVVDRRGMDPEDVFETTERSSARRRDVHLDR